MKAIRIHEHGAASSLKIDALEIPAIADDETLIKVKATTLNHLDIWVREGIPGVPLPMIMGSDCAGLIEDIGNKAKRDFNLNIGDEVIAAPIRFCGKCKFCREGKENLCSDFHIPGESVQGVQAEYVAVKAKYILPKPENSSWEEAAAFPLASMTAYHMLVSKAGIKAGDSLLIYGASSGVGSAAIQFAKTFGAQVITTAGSGEKADLAKRLGADFIINYKDESVAQKVREFTRKRGVDIVFEHTGAKTWNDSLRALCKGGKLVTCGATTGAIVKIDLRALFIKHQQLIGSTMGTISDLQEIINLIIAGKYKPIIDRVYHYSQIWDAHKRLESGAQFGKVVVTF